MILGNKEKTQVMKNSEPAQLFTPFVPGNREQSL